MKDALIVFAKVPVPGRVKTRLTDVLSDEEAARLYEAFLRDALVQYEALDADVRLYLSPSTASLPRGLVPEGVDVSQQTGDDLGARMTMAFIDTFSDGYERVIIVGTDHPTLPSSFIEQAFVALKEPRSLCIGPSEDGGYYLLGMNDLYPRVFADMTYSHADVFEETLDRIRKTDAHLTVLPLWYDVDTPEALEHLVNDLEKQLGGAPHTRAVLGDLLAAVRDA